MSVLEELEKEEKLLAEHLGRDPFDFVANYRWEEIQKELAKFPLEQRTSPFIYG